MRGEASIQKSVVAYAKKRGVVCVKLHSPGFGSAGWPDYLFLPLYPFRPWCIEFKREGGKLTPLQAQRHKELTGRVTVYVCDDVVKGKSIVDYELRVT
jgi:hypothetical protein